jgi:hypothetical protein
LKFGQDPGAIHVRVFRIINFTNTAGFRDKTDPYVKLQYGTTMHKTSVKNNAGGNAVFNEVFSFFKNPSQTQLRVAVYDSDTLRDDVLGANTIDLNRQRLCNSEEELRRMPEGQSYDVFDATGKVRGQVVLAFAVSVSAATQRPAPTVVYMSSPQMPMPPSVLTVPSTVYTSPPLHTVTPMVYTNDAPMLYTSPPLQISPAVLPAP